MPTAEKPYYSFNRGIVSSLGLSRVDVEPLALSAETMTNWMPRVLGSMMMRPGFQYIETVRGTDEEAILYPFLFSVDDKAIVEFTGSAEPITTGFIRILIDDVPLARPTITAAVSNAFFISNLNDWADEDEAGATSTWASDTAFNGKMNLRGDGLNRAIRRQEVTVNETGVEHALRITVTEGPVTLRVGSTEGGDEYIAEVGLEKGSHDLSFTPTGDFWIELSNRLKYTVICEGCSLQTTTNAINFSTGINATDLNKIRFDQSGDVVYISVEGHQPKKLIRRGNTRSFSYVDDETETGPYRTLNITDITMAPNALEGDATVIASKDFFRDEHLRALIRISSNGQTVQSDISAEDNFTNPIRVDGVGDSRIFNVDIAGTWTATVTIQYSVGAPGAWVDLATQYTGNVSTTIDDGLDNQIVFYRIGVKTGDYTSGTVDAQLSIAAGSITGVGRIYDVNNATSVDVRVIKPFGSTSPSKDWWEGAWSEYRGWPTAVAFYEGRRWNAGLSRIWGSVSDEFDNFDDLREGSAGSISRSIGYGPVQNIHWLMPLGRLAMGTAQNSANVAPAIIDGNNSIVARSSSFDEPLTPTNFNLKNVDPSGFFVDRSRARLYLLTEIDNRYQPMDLSIAVPDLNAVGIKYIAAQMKPDIRVHCIREDGTASVLVFAREEEVAGWIEIETDGDIEHCCVFPGLAEDEVYYVVKRTVDGTVRRYIEKWALESECVGGLLNKQADSFIVYDGAATTTISGLDHLEGETVIVWADGIDVGTSVVSGGQITLSTAASKVVVGLIYTAQYKSPKLANATTSSLNMKKKVDQIGVIAQNLHYQGLQYGPDFDNLYDLPLFEDGAEQAANTIHTHYDEDRFPFGGVWDTDSRLCLQAQAPRPCTLLSAVIEFEQRS